VRATAPSLVPLASGDACRTDRDGAAARSDGAALGQGL